MLDILDIQKNRKQKTAVVAVKEQDYSRYGFRESYGDLKPEDAEVILILLTVAHLINCQIVKDQIKEAIENQELKDFILLDILTECDETFFDKDTKAKTIKNITQMDDEALVDAFKQIADQINY